MTIDLLTEDEKYRLRRTQELNAAKLIRDQLEEKYGDVWDTKQLQVTFSVLGFLAPFVSVIRKSDDKKGTLEFQGSPRFYFNFEEA